MTPRHLPHIPWYLKKLLRRYRDKLVNYAQELNIFDPEISREVDCIDSIFDANHKNKCRCRKCLLKETRSV